MNATPNKETKAQRVERLKREKNPWLHLDEIRDFARRGHASIPPEWLSTYFRPWGVYTQGDGQGLTGGSGGEGRAVPFFMVRIRIPNGLLTTQQVREIADLSDHHGNGVADITVRQNIQLHWVRIESLPGLFDQLHSVGLSTTGACGDVSRNITGCPLAGLDSREIADVSPVALAIDRELAGNPDFYNLPRKFKITVTGCPDWCSYPEINDIALTAARRLRPENVGAGLQPGPALQAADKGPSRHCERSLRNETSLFSWVSANGAGAAPLDFKPAGFDSASLPNHEPQLTTHELGFSLRVAGGLSSEPHVAVRLNAFIRQHQVIPVVRVITKLFRSSEVLRQSREQPA
jgi:sulfite reductase beta subunit-like hemoprotein